MRRTEASGAGAPDVIACIARGTLDRERMRGTSLVSGIAFVLAASIGCGGEGNSTDTVDAGASDVSAPPDAHCVTPSEPPRLIFLSRGGGIYTKGEADDSSNNVSVVLQADTQIVPVPTISDGLWTQVVACVAAKFAPFNVRVVDTDPAPTPHREAVFVDRMSDIGFPSTTSAIAPSVCASDDEREPGSRAIIFAAIALYANATDICENAVMSLGFTLDLDRSLHAPDLMSYFPSPSKTFVDMDVPCGDHEQRACKCDAGPTQNSYQKLLALAGPACE